MPARIYQITKNAMQSGMAKTDDWVLEFETAAPLRPDPLMGWIGRWVLVSPVAHRIHHSDLPEHHDRNLGHVFIIWDRIFGTWYDGRVVNTTVGIVDNPYNREGMAADLLTCARRTYGAVLAPLWRRGPGR